jgi:toxin secretion/phage lysis holin
MTHRIAIFSAASGLFGGIISAVIGGWDLALETLAIIMLLDYCTGLIVAGVFHKSPKSEGGALESKAAFKGLCKKALIVVIVVAFHQADRLTGKSFFRDGACWAFFIAEMISILENVGLIFPLPAFITKCLDWFKDKGDKLGDEIEGHDKPPDERV